MTLTNCTLGPQHGERGPAGAIANTGSLDVSRL